jgi:hypothetical protein
MDHYSENETESSHPGSENGSQRQFCIGIRRSSSDTERNASGIGLSIESAGTWRYPTGIDWSMPVGSSHCHAILIGLVREYIRTQPDRDSSDIELPGGIMNTQRRRARMGLIIKSSSTRRRVIGTGSLRELRSARGQAAYIEQPQSSENYRWCSNGLEQSRESRDARLQPPLWARQELRNITAQAYIAWHYNVLFSMNLRQRVIELDRRIAMLQLRLADMIFIIKFISGVRTPGDVRSGQSFYLGVRFQANPRLRRSLQIYSRQVPSDPKFLKAMLTYLVK